MKPTLNLADPQRLLYQLKSGAFTEELNTLGMPESEFQGLDPQFHEVVPEYPHLRTLQKFLCARGLPLRQGWARCCRQLVAMKAPLETGVASTAFESFAEFDWAFSPELNAELLRHYVDKGAIDMATPLRGSLHRQCDTVDGHDMSQSRGMLRTDGIDHGRLPLAACIMRRNLEMVRCFVSAGASMDIGKVFEDGPSWDALALCEDLAIPEVGAVIRECLLRGHLDGALRGPVASAERPDAAAPRRRLGV
jgi:hypothetical protein